MNERDRHNLFSDLLARHQSELYAYIFAIVQNWEDADDLYQSTCLILWRKFELFRPDSSFFAWARQTAQIEVRNFLRRKKSSNYVSEEVVDALAAIAIDVRGDGADLYLAALQRCRGKLSPTDDELLRLRYVEDLGSRQIADRLQRPYRSVCNSLNRIRWWLLQCIQTELAQQDHSKKSFS
jgi:RNA polymerase sigma-70 factor, ECF subfamily